MKSNSKQVWWVRPTYTAILWHLYKDTEQETKDKFKGYAIGLPNFCAGTSSHSKGDEIPVGLGS